METPQRGVPALRKQRQDAPVLIGFDKRKVPDLRWRLAITTNRINSVLRRNTRVIQEQSHNLQAGFSTIPGTGEDVPPDDHSDGSRPGRTGFQSSRRAFA